MPFDNTNQTDTIRIIDAVIEALGPKGQRWRKGELTDANGRHCLRGALFYVRRRLDVRGDRATELIRQAITEVPGLPKGWFTMEPFNDRPETKFGDVRAVLERARELAMRG